MADIANTKIKTLSEITYRRIAQLRFSGLDSEEKGRLKHELAIIELTKTEDLFLDFISQADEARKHGEFYIVGAANCSFLLCCARATTLSPMIFHAPFERFINEAFLDYDNLSAQFQIHFTKNLWTIPSEQVDIKKLLFERAVRSGVVDCEKLYSISKSYLPASNYQFVAEVLSDSHGIIVWQEQVIELLHRMGGFTYSEADALRREGYGGLWEDKKWYAIHRKRFLDHALCCGYDYYFADKYFRYIFEANMYAPLEAAVAAKLLAE